MRIYLLCGLLLCGSAFGRGPEDCGPVDLRGPLLGEVRNQGIAGFCFAYAVADLVSFRVGEKISAMDAGVAHFFSTSSDSILPTWDEGGETTPTLDGINSLGWCSEADFPSDELPRDLQKGGNGRFKPSFERMESWFRSGKGSIMTAVNRVYPHLRRGDVDEIRRASRTTKEFLVGLTKRNCVSGRRPSAFRAVTVKSTLPNGGDRLIPSLDAWLNQGEIVAIGYSSAEFYSDARLLAMLEETDDSLHASTIVGRRWVDGKCEYLIRDSFGTDCSIYRTPEKCEAGHVWVPEDFIHRNVYEVEILERP